jgi:sulfatase maturation enzyme AslB (radical SAM superfamily)
MHPSKFIPLSPTHTIPETMPGLPGVWPKNAPSYFHVLGKPTGATCNLDCTYCFFLSKEKLYPNSRFRMSDDLLETYIRQVIESQRVPEVTISWQGGEPTLMGLDFFKRSIEYVNTYARPGVTIQHTMQTNGILLNEAWRDFFREHHFLIGLSLDGPQAMHDTYRVDKGGAPTFHKVMRAAWLLQEHHVEFNILTTVNAANADHPLEVYRFIETPDGEPGLNYLCAGYKAFFHHVDKPMHIMAELLRRDRAPAEVMLVLAAEEAQVQKAYAKAGRNEPCPCGSGRKFKHCHGR